jgi:hypothetical protein
MTAEHPSAMLKQKKTPYDKSHTAAHEKVKSDFAQAVIPSRIATVFKGVSALDTPETTNQKIIRPGAGTPRRIKRRYCL